MAGYDSKRRRKNLSSGEKDIINNVYSELKHRNQEMLVNDVVKLCSVFTKVSVRTIYNIIKEKKVTASSSTKNENNEVEAKGRKKIQLDDHTKQVIRRTFHSFFFRNEIPNLKKVQVALESVDTIPHISRVVLLRTLRQMKICYRKRSRQSHLIEKDDIIIWRRNYLETMREYRRNDKKIYYLDETWLNEGYTVSKVWQDMNVTNRRQAFIDGLSTGLKAPPGKGRRLIITHIGSESGFVENGLLVFESKKTCEYHEEMDARRFEQWFLEILPKLEPGSIVVMDNASYHSRRLEALPTSQWKKGQIIEWLVNKNIPHDPNKLKPQLLNLARIHKNKYLKYAVDEMARTHNITVHRLPPYHCELNPIELAWAQIKSQVARNNTTFKLADVKGLFDSAVNSVTAESWQQFIEHVIKEENRMWDLDTRIDVTVEPLLIDLGANDSSSDDDSDSDSDGDSENGGMLNNSL